MQDQHNYPSALQSRGKREQYDEFDFDTMVTLARDFPEKFAARRTQLIEFAITSCIYPERGRSFQFTIDKYINDIPVGQEPYVKIMAQGLGILVEQFSNFLDSRKSEG